MVKDIKKIFEQPTFASKGGLKEFNDEQRAKGWESIGKEAPESTQFNVLQNDVERGVKYLYGQIRGTIRSTSPNYVPDEMKATDLREAIEGISKAQTAQAIQQAKDDALAANRNAESRLAKAANLSDIADKRQARENLGLGKLAQEDNYPEENLNQKGITQLSSATDSDSETMAATPKAVKAIADTLSGGRLLNIQSFTRSGTYTPTPGTRKVKVILTGGGASGGINSSSENYGRSGGAGGTRIAFIDEPIDGTYVTIGAGGEAVTNVGAVGNPGGDSIFGNLMKANGGTTDFGLGGSSSGSGFGIDGGNGTSGGSQGNSTIGGVSYWGGGGTGVNTSESLSARAHGSGGAGVSSSSTSSGSGANGICIIEEYS